MYASIKSQQSTPYIRQTTNLPIQHPPCPPPPHTQHSKEKQAHNTLRAQRVLRRQWAAVKGPNTRLVVVVAKSTPNIGWTSGLPLTDELKERTNCSTDWQSGSWCRRCRCHWVFTLHVWRRRRLRCQRQEVFCPSLPYAACRTPAPATCLALPCLSLAWLGCVSCLLGWFLVWFGLACLGLNISYRWEKRVGRVGRSVESVAL